MWRASVCAMCVLVRNPFECDPDTCLLSCEDLSVLDFTVLASDGYVYNALQLQKWVSMCIREVRQVQIVPGKPITWVCPVQVVYTCESVPKNDVDVSLASAIESMPDERAPLSAVLCGDPEGGLTWHRFELWQAPRRLEACVEEDPILPGSAHA